MHRIFLDINKANSHQNKSLSHHIIEIIEFSETFYRLGYRFDKDLLRLLAIYHDLGKCYYLWQKYSIQKNIKLVKHSGLSAFITYLILVKNKMELGNILKVPNLNLNLELGTDEIKYLIYLILVHHSDLKRLDANAIDSKFNLGSPFEKNINQVKDLMAILPNTDESEFEEFKNYIISFNPSDLDLNTKYINTYAAFKIADRLSGSFHRNLSKEEIPKILYKFGITNIDFNLNEEVIRNLLSNKEISGKVDENRLREQIKFLENDIKILLAPTGFGKTVFSIFKGITNKKMLIALPTITAIKQFLKKTGAIINEIGYFSNNIGTYFYFYNPFKTEEEDDNLILNEYFLSRYLLKPIMLTTVDQLLLTYLQSKEYYIKKFALQNRILIVDEIHLLTPKMLYFLLQFLKEYRSIFRDFVLMSATFPEFLIDIIRSELEIKDSNIIRLYNYYPKNRIWIEFLNDDFEIKKEKKEKLFDDIYKKLKDITKDKKPKIIVLFNTVINAQEFYKYLKEKGENWDILLFHSRYIYKHRKEIEKKLLKISKAGRLDKPFILIATQVVEVSLDIDLDYLITESAPLQELIQRFGRVFRNRDQNLPPKEPNIYIFGFLEESNRIYDKELVKESIDIIKDFRNIVDEEKLVKKLNESEIYKNTYLKEFEDARNKYDEFVDELLNKYANRFYYIFVEEDEETLKKISKLLNIRDSINSLVFVNPEDLDKKEAKKYNKLLKDLEESRKSRDFVKFFRSKLYLREFLLPIPFYYILPLLDVDNELVRNEKIPVIPPKVYSKEFGIDVKKLKEILESKIFEEIIM
ncbi:MAG: hypothetical protein BXU00_01455 [Candidatus Nanoclepta minutus]|uniref:CRISPR-associated helicase/endonuclease Cas3 n=1 Tax=Candidatus Nanoclepta minutus TaxID=1940235 RepID=A0A397WMW8_9ARCH|nr:MAG: hypothetical protein BXU00_01455 [Candidatus Nanoclepta minutus]